MMAMTGLGAFRVAIDEWSDEGKSDVEIWTETEAARRAYPGFEP
jgi:hypothetical protein